jgi:hypothetical protein
MTQFHQAILTAAITAPLTVAGAVVVFAITQLLQRYFLDPLQEYAKSVIAVDFTLLLYGNVTGTPRGFNDAQRTEARRAIRECASRYLSAANAIRWWWLARCLGFVPESEDVSAVVGKLIGLSNMGDGSVQEEPGLNTRWGKEIATLLNLRVRPK